MERLIKAANKLTRWARLSGHRVRHPLRRRRLPNLAACDYPLSMRGTRRQLKQQLPRMTVTAVCTQWQTRERNAKPYDPPHRTRARSVRTLHQRRFYRPFRVSLSTGKSPQFYFDLQQQAVAENKHGHILSSAWRNFALVIVSSSLPCSLRGQSSDETDSSGQSRSGRCASDRVTFAHKGRAPSEA